MLGQNRRFVLPVVPPPEVEAHPRRNAIHDFYRQHLPQIITRYVRGTVYDCYIYTIQDRMVAAQRMLDDIFLRQTFCFKVNGSLGCILENTETRELRYFHGCWSNTPLFEEAHFITRRADWDSFMTELQSMDLIFEASKNAGST